MLYRFSSAPSTALSTNQPSIYFSQRDCPNLCGATQSLYTFKNFTDILLVHALCLDDAQGLQVLVFHVDC